MLGDRKTPDQVKRLFDGVRGAPAVVTAEENALLLSLRGCTMIHPAMSDEVRLECPAWAAEPLRRRFGKAFEPEMAATLTTAPLDLRVNPIKTTREAVLRALKKEGLKAVASTLSPHGSGSASGSTLLGCRA